LSAQRAHQIEKRSNIIPMKFRISGLKASRKSGEHSRRFLAFRFSARGLTGSPNSISSAKVFERTG
jgi:hypothetical protein